MVTAFIKSTIKRVLSCLPLSVRRGIDVVGVSLADLVQYWRLPMYRVKARLPDSDTEACVVFFGDLPQYRTWTHKFFGRVIEPDVVDDVSFFQVLLGSVSASDVDIMVFPCNPVTASLLSMRGWYLTPRLLHCRIDLSPSVGDIFSGKGAKKEIKVVDRKNYTFKLLNVDECFCEFYDEMLLPTISVRHGDCAVISSRETLHATMQGGFLLGAFLGEEWLGACMLVRESPSVLRFANGAYRAGDPALLKNSILSALQVEMVALAKEKGFRWLDTGACNPFPTDGILQSKMKWGGAYSPPQIEYDGASLSGVRSFFSLKLNLAQPGARQILNRTPIFDMTGGKLRVIGWNAAVPSMFKRDVKVGLEWVNLDALSAVKTHSTRHDAAHFKAQSTEKTCHDIEG